MAMTGLEQIGPSKPMFQVILKSWALFRMEVILELMACFQWQVQMIHHIIFSKQTLVAI